MAPGSFFKSAVAVVAGVYAAMPDHVRMGAQVMVLFLVLDGITGVHRAARKGEVSSHRMRGGLWTKLRQYAGIVGIFGGISILTQSAYSLTAGLIIVTAMEATSIIENVLYLQTHGGAPLPRWAVELLMSKQKYFAGAAQAADDKNTGEVPDPSRSQR